MSSFQNTTYASTFDELGWVAQLRRTLEEELEDDNVVPVCIFNVPKILMASNPDSYTPQEVAIGPYHYLRPEVYEMQRYKIAAAKRTQKHLQNHKFQHLVQQLTKHEHRIRSCYHKYLEFSGETLAWMMAIDASFLLEFLQVYAAPKEGKVLNRLSSRMSHLVDYAGQKSAHNAILRDIVMLENQIPLFVLRKMSEFQLSSLEAADDMLFSMLSGFSKELSPFKMVNSTTPNPRVSDCAHLLDFLYDTIIPKMRPEDAMIDMGDEECQPDGDQGTELGDKESSFGSSNSVKQLLGAIWMILSNIKKGPIRLLQRLLFSRPVKVLLKLPWTIVSNLPVLRMLKAPIEVFFKQAKEDAKPEDDTETDNKNMPPLIEEITIPSVTELSKSGVHFTPTNGNISTISFDPKTVTFYLPTVSLDVNTDAVLRNLVAYEASTASGPLVFTRYTEMMNGIIDTEDDVKLLRERGIVLNRLKSDEEAADLWNGMSKSIRLTKVPFLDKAIEEVNKYHNGRWRVKIGNFMKLYVFGSWQFLTLLAAVLMLLLMGLQAFCSVYTCSRIFHLNSGDKN